MVICKKIDRKTSKEVLRYSINDYGFFHCYKLQPTYRYEHFSLTKENDYFNATYEELENLYPKELYETKVMTYEEQYEEIEGNIGSGIFKKVEKATGITALRYLIYDGCSAPNGNEYEFIEKIKTFRSIKRVKDSADLRNLGNYVIHIEIFNDVKYIIIINKNMEVEFCSPIIIGDAIMPWTINLGNTCQPFVNFYSTKVYTSKELEEAFPSDKYDTVKVS